ncbi:MAG: AmmeMemoRadiSam system radical SAM enzyme [Syntrophomonas sp.]|nr:AmmeMemoRadiSam system radical SAM enzyme [Syntrophomonas sp.]
MAEIEAMYYEKMDKGVVRCVLCPQHCKLKDGQVGLCRVRSNRAGVLFTSNYGEISSLALDPIEKKPLFHFYPGSCILSAGSFGCNLACSFCQNYGVAHGNPPTHYLEPESLVELTRNSCEDGSIGLAFTYNEPSIWYEYILAVAPRLKEQGLKSVLVTNGYVEKEPLERLLPYIDACNIDVKAFNAQFYPELCQGKLQAVKETVENVIGKMHVEITTLLIPGKNDGEPEIRELSRWLASLDPNIVLHLSRYHPAYKLNLPPTPEATMIRAQEIAREYLNFVYTGNLPGEENNTYCRHCGNLLIQRNAYHVQLRGMEDEMCSSCQVKPTYIKGI